MKRNKLFIAAALAGLLTASCGSDDNRSDSTTVETGAPETTEASTETTEAATETTEAATETTGAGEETTTTVSDNVDTDAVFRWSHSGMPPTLDPTESPNATVIYAFFPVYDTLTELNPAGELEPGIATDWEFSSDALTLTLTIAEGLTFHDGSPLDAEAVVANLERARNGTATARALATVTGLEAPDVTTVVITLSEPTSALPASLADYAGMMVAPASFDDPNIATMPIGSGPFKIVENTEAQITYERWDEYKGTNPTRIAGIEFIPIADDTARLNALRSGQIDGTFIRTTQVEEAESAGLVVTQAARVQVYGFLINPRNEALANPDVRRALMHAVDREAVNQGLYAGGCSATIQFFPETYYAYDESIDDAEYGAYDTDRAKELITGVDIPSLEIMTPAIPTYSNLAVAVQAALAEIGIDSTVREVEPTASLGELREGNFDLAMSAFDTARPDPSAVFANYFLPGGSFNPAGYEVPGLADLFAEINATSGDERLELIGDATQAVLDDGSLMVPICTPLLSVATRAGVGGVEPPVLGNYRFDTVVIEKE